MKDFADWFVWIFIIFVTIAAIIYFTKMNMPKHESIRGLKTERKVDLNGSVEAILNPINPVANTIEFKPLADVFDLTNKIKAETNAEIDVHSFEDMKILKAHLPSGDVIAATSDTVPNAMVKLAAKLGVSVE